MLKFERCTFFIYLPLPHHSPKTFFVNFLELFLFSLILYLIFTIIFLEVTKKKRIFAART